MNLTQRSIGTMILLMIVTLGIYILYWLAVTKKELNQLGAQIPTAWLIIIPFANIYFLYAFAKGFATTIIKDSNQSVAYFLLLIFLLPIGELICQSNINERITRVY